MLEYLDGANYHSHCNSGSRKAVIMFTCDESATDVSVPFYLINNNHSCVWNYLPQAHSSAIQHCFMLCVP